MDNLGKTQFMTKRRQFFYYFMYKVDNIIL